MRTYQFTNRPVGVFAGIVGEFERQNHPFLGAIGLRTNKLWAAIVIAPFGCTWLSVYDDDKLVFHRDVSESLLKFSGYQYQQYRTADMAAFLKLESINYKHNRLKAEKLLLDTFTPLIDGAINEQRRKTRPSRSKRRNGKPVPSSRYHDTED